MSDINPGQAVYATDEVSIEVYYRYKDEIRGGFGVAEQAGSWSTLAECGGMSQRHLNRLELDLVRACINQSADLSALYIEWSAIHHCPVSSRPCRPRSLETSC